MRPDPTPPHFAVWSEREYAPSVDAAAPTQPDRLLVIEDDPANRLMLVHAFQPYSRVYQADRGEAALALFREHRPDFVLTDLMLPGMDGIEVMRRIRRTSQGACVPFMVLTANQNDEALVDCFRAGADDFMVKPVRIPELRIRVSSIHLRQRMVRDVNPLTSLPGNMVLKSEMGLRMEEERPFTVLYIDLDHFKSFNDDRGFDAGDEAIQMVGECMVELAQSDRFGEPFIGHVGGDDFVALLEDQHAQPFARALFECFDREKTRFYSKAERERGYVDIRTRSGEVVSVPILSLSVGGVTTSRPGVDDVRHLTHLAAEVKHAAKAEPGNTLIIDRRQLPIGPAASID